MANKSIGKNLLRVSSMFLAALMLVLTTFTGVNATTVNAATTDEYVVKVAMNRNSTFGQNVELEAGKTYILSLYTSSDVTLMARYPGTYNTISNDASGFENDIVYRKKYIKFTVPSDAPDTENGKKSLWVGIANTKLGYYVYYYGFKLYNAEDPDVNLLRDADLSSGASDIDSGIWCTSSGGTLPSGLYTRVTLASIGGMDKFEKTDDERYAIKLSANSSSSYAFFGQWVSLEAGKTYVLSNCYTDDNLGYLIRYTDSTTNENVDLSTDMVNYDNDYFRKSATFTVPTTAVKDENGTTSVWVGINCWKRTYEVYYYDFKLYDVKNPEVNLYEDYALIENGTSIGNVWSRPSGNLYPGYYSRTTLTEAGGMDVFKKTDADRYVVKMDSGYDRYFGQSLALEAGNTYTFSYYYTGNDAGYLVRIEDGNYTNISDAVISYDDNWLKKHITFTVPADNEYTIWVGIKGSKNADEVYYYDFELYDVENPQVNLLKDQALLDNGSSLDNNIWKQPSAALASGISKTTLEAAGGMDIFKKPVSVIGVYNRKYVTLGQNVVLEAGKTYSYTYYYSGPALVSGLITNGDGVGAEKFATTKILYDDEYNKVTYEFVAPETAISAGVEGKVVVYLGIQIPTADTYYFYNPCVYAIDDATKTNLFYDYNFTATNTLTNANGAPNWYRHYDYASVGNNFSRPTLEATGGIEFFKKTDANRFVLKLASETSGQPYFGQLVTLEAGKTYIYSNCYMAGNESIQEVYEVFEDNTRAAIDIEITADTEMSRNSVKFTVPEDESGSKLIYVGLRGSYKGYAQYYYDFKLYEEGNPEDNLLTDPVLLQNSLNIDGTVWTSPSGVKINENYSKVTLESLGGVNIFLSFEKKCDVTLDEKIDIRDLVRMKKFSVGTIDSLADGRGDLNGDLTYADAADLIVLRKEILK